MIGSTRPISLQATLERLMNIYWIQQFCFNDYYNSTPIVEHYYLRSKNFGTRNVAVSWALNVLGAGANIADPIPGHS